MARPRAPHTLIIRKKVIELVKLGYSSEEMAKEIGVTEVVIKAHLQFLYRRTGITEGDKRVSLVVLLTEPLNSPFVEAIIRRNSKCQFSTPYVNTEPMDTQVQ